MFYENEYNNYFYSRSIFVCSSPHYICLKRDFLSTRSKQIIFKLNVLIPIT